MRPLRTLQGRLGLVAAAGLILTAPFETLRPWVELPGQKLSNLELAIAAGIALWLAELLGGYWRGGARRAVLSFTRWRQVSKEWPFLAPLGLLMLVMTLAALTASEYSGAALRFMGRLVAAFLIYLLFSFSARSQGRLLFLLTVSTIPALVVSSAGILEYFEIPLMFDLLAPFRAGPSFAGTEVRASGTLQYPTITAMYLEIAFGWIVGLLLQGIRSGKRGASAMLFVIASALGTGLILTLTRSALLIMGLLLAVAAVTVARQASPRRPLQVLAALGLTLVLLFGLLLSAGPNLWLRLTTFDQRNWYQVEYLVPETLEMQTGETALVQVTVVNRGLASWSGRAETPFRLSYHWLSADGEHVLEYEGLRTELPRPVRAGESITFRARVEAPFQPGDYLLAWDLLQENRFWFSREFAPSAHSRVTVTGRATSSAPSPQVMPRSRLILDRLQLWTTALRVLASNPWLGVGPDNFRRVYGRYLDLDLVDLTYHTHNLYLEFFLSAGLIGGAIFLWLVWRLLASVGRGLSDPEPNWAVSISPALAVLAILAHGFFDYFLEFTPTYLMIFAAIGMLEASRQVKQPRQ